MDPSLLYFLAGCLLWAALLFYVFFVRREQDLGAGGKSGFVVIIGIIIPVIGLALWNQAQSNGKLEELGFSRYPGLGSSVGVSAGSADQPTWLYSLKAPKGAVLEFYKQPDNHRGWRFISETPDSLVFSRGSSRMDLHISNDTAAFMLFSPGEE